MLTFKEGEKLMEEMNTTPEELDMMWDTCVKAGHRLIAQLDRCGEGWRDLDSMVIKTLPREFIKIINQGR